MKDETAKAKSFVCKTKRGMRSNNLIACLDKLVFIL